MKKNTLSTIILIMVFFVGLSLLLYPTVSNYWNTLHQSRAIADYVENVSSLDSEVYEELLTAARNYNEKIAKMEYNSTFTKEVKKEYESLLNVSGNGIIGYIKIAKIGCSLPIYHGTEEKILQIAVGHLDWTSLPVGGEGTHCVLVGHRGLPSAKLFTDLDKLNNGDTFVIRVLEETFTYEVDQILIVEPDEVETLQIVDGKDYCTLVTCTPYGINTHRLLVRGHRVENQAEAENIRATTDDIQIEPIMVVIPILIFLLGVLIICICKKKEWKRGKREKRKEKRKKGKGKREKRKGKKSHEI